MYTLYSMQRSGNSYKVRLALARLGIPYKLVEVDILQGRKPHARISRQESERTGAAARSRARSPSRRVERDPLVRRRRHDAGAGRSHRARRSAAMDVLRAAQPGAEYRRRLFLARADQGRTRPAEPRARGLDGKRLSRARRDGDAPQPATPISSPTTSPSPTSRSTPIPMSPTSAISTSAVIRRFAPGSTASPTSRATSRWTGSRSWSRRSSAANSTAF